MRFCCAAVRAAGSPAGDAAAQRIKLYEKVADIDKHPDGLRALL